MAIPDDRIHPETNLTDEEIKVLKECRTRDDYQNAKYEIRARRGCFFPPDWLKVTLELRVRERCEM